MAWGCCSHSVRIDSVPSVTLSPPLRATNFQRSTESYDGMGPVGQDERWEVFGPFHDYLAQSFPLTYVIHLRNYNLSTKTLMQSLLATSVLR